MYALPRAGAGWGDAGLLWVSERASHQNGWRMQSSHLLGSSSHPLPSPNFFPHLPTLPCSSASGLCGLHLCREILVPCWRCLALYRTWAEVSPSTHRLPAFLVSGQTRVAPARFRPTSSSVPPWPDVVSDLRWDVSDAHYNRG
jgi:hypothetical protein